MVIIYGAGSKDKCSSVNFFVVFSLIASVDFKNSYDEWCVVIQKAQDKARFLLKEYDQKFVALKVERQK